MSATNGAKGTRNESHLCHLNPSLYSQHQNIHPSYLTVGFKYCTGQREDEEDINEEEDDLDGHVEKQPKTTSVTCRSVSISPQDTPKTPPSCPKTRPATIKPTSDIAANNGDFSVAPKHRIASRTVLLG